MKFDLEVYRRELKSKDGSLTFYDSQSDSHRMIPASLNPLVIEDEVWQPIVESSQILLKGMNALTQLWNDPQYSDRVKMILSELSPYERRAFDPSRRIDLATARMDLFFDGATLKIIEANTTIPAMQAYSDIIRTAWLKAHDKDDGRAPNSEALLKSLLFLYTQNGGAKPSPRIAIVAREGDAQISELNFLKSVWNNLNFDTQIVQPGQLKIKSEQLVHRVSGKAFDLIYRHIFASRLDAASDFAKALLLNEVFHIYNPVAGQLEIKALFAELSSYVETPERASRLGLDENEQRLLVKCMPWTRILDKNARSSEREEWKSTRPSDYVVKISSGYGGHSVFVGSEFHLPESQSRLRTLMRRSGVIDWPDFIEFCTSLSDGVWIIQRRLQGRRMKHSFLYDNVREQESFVDASIFAWAHSVPSGGASRFARDPIVNLGRGGGLLPLFLRSEYDALTKDNTPMPDGKALI